MSKKTKIIIDCGHGGIDTNGIYTTAPAKQALVNGEMIHEGVINREIGRTLHKLLIFDGYDATYTVDFDDPTDVSLKRRVEIANSFNDAILVSIHCNAFNGKARGFEIFTTRKTNRSDILAECIANSIEPLEEKGLVMRFDESDGDKDKEADHYVTRKTKHWSTLVECFFFDNEKDIELYRDPAWITDFVERLKEGIKNFINKE